MVEIPQNLRMGLEKIEATGVVPLFIPQALENFLTEQGVYQSSMTPEEAWQALSKLAKGENPTQPTDTPPDASSVEITEPETASPGASSIPEPSVTSKTTAPAAPTASSKPPIPATGLQRRIARKRKR